MILGAVGTGKTSACMYPYVDQLLRWRRDDADRKVGGLVMEVKGDFCRQVHAILKDARRADDYVEIGLDTGVCYNPLHNDLDPYAVAYAIAALLNNLFGKSKEPFWQQAYTDLLKFVILLRRLTDGYTTFAEVYRYILDDTQIDHDIRKLQDRAVRAAGGPAGADGGVPGLLTRSVRGRIGIRKTRTTWRTRTTPSWRRTWPRRACRTRVQRAQGTGWTARKHQLEALERWYVHGWSRLDARLRSSITEGVVVFLSLFDDNPAVHRAFCPPRSAYMGTLARREPAPSGAHRHVCSTPAVCSP